MMKTKIPAAGQLSLFDEVFSGVASSPSSSSLDPTTTTTGSVEPFDSTMPMMLLSLWQPWASLCVWTNPVDGLAEKQVETRHWQTAYRGLVAVHATKTLTPDARFAIEGNRQIRDALRRHDCLSGEIYGGDLKFAERRLTFGAIVGVVELVAVHSFDESGEDWVEENFPAREKHFGNYEAGRFGWVFKKPIAFETPIPCRGLQSLGTPPAEVRAQIFDSFRSAMSATAATKVLNNNK